MSDKIDETKKDVDPELDDLLDSALQDMTKKPAEKNEIAKPEEVNDVPQNMWSEEFIKEAAAQFESNMAALLGNFTGMPEDQITQEQIAQTFTKMAEAATMVLKPTPEGGEAEEPVSNDPLMKEKIDEVSAAISQTLQNLNTNTESLQAPLSDQDLANMFKNLQVGEGQDANMFIPFMQGMMQSLLSKEVLYPSLKDMVERYPKWLADNKGKIEQSNYDRYEKQLDLMLKVCAELEPEQESDPEDVKRKRFENVLGLMQTMQELGQPPEELIGDLGLPPEMIAATEQTSNQCSVM